MLKITRGTSGSESTRFELAGTIDNVADFTTLSAVATRVVELDMKKVMNANSFGIKKLLVLVAELNGKGKMILFHGCPSQLISTLNMIPSLTRAVRVESFGLPMACDACNTQYEKMVTAGEARAPGFITSLNERYPCDKCARQLTFVDDEQIYFRFLGDV